MPLTIHDKLSLVTVTEDTDWEALGRHSTMGRHLVKVLSPRAVLIEPEAVDPLLAYLRKNGYLPQVLA